MKNLFKAAALGLFLAPSVAFPAKAPNTFTKQITGAQGTVKLLDGVALNAAAATRTIDIDIGADWSKVVVFVDHTANSACTTIVATPTYSPDGDTFFAYTTRSISAGASTVSALVDTFAVSGTASFALEYDVRAAKSLKLVFSGASCGGSDTVDVYVSVVAGQ